MHVKRKKGKKKQKTNLTFSLSFVRETSALSLCIAACTCQKSFLNRSEV